MRNAIKWSAMVGAVVVASVFAVSCMESDEESEEEDVGEVTEGGDGTPAGEEVQAVEVGEAAAGTPEIKLLKEGEECPLGTLCLWDGFEMSGYGKWFLQFGQGCIPLRRHELNNKVSSWENRSVSNYRVFASADCSGRKFTARSGESVERMKEWSNKASSICRVGFCP